jgi:hypothetical protein
MAVPGSAKGDAAGEGDAGAYRNVVHANDAVENRCLAVPLELDMLRREPNGGDVEGGLSAGGKSQRHREGEMQEAQHNHQYGGGIREVLKEPGGWSLCGPGARNTVISECV